MGCMSSRNCCADALWCLECRVFLLLMKQLVGEEGKNGRHLGWCLIVLKEFISMAEITALACTDNLTLPCAHFCLITFPLICKM
mmetsp:Transcript_46851/g.86964  ORF Transcript_46851/g.86964 Transcript_46851/m.86964 type:complete len:84 (-) Transcript_46851:124-375(-)